MIIQLDPCEIHFKLPNKKISRGGPKPKQTKNKHIILNNCIITTIACVNFQMEKIEILVEVSEEKS